MLTLADKLQLIRSDLIAETAQKLIDKLSREHFFDHNRIFIVEINYTSKVVLPEDIKINIEDLRNQYDTLSITREGSFQAHDIIEGRNKLFNTIELNVLIYLLCYIEQNILKL